jgi:hypothetical protein
MPVFGLRGSFGSDVKSAGLCATQDSGAGSFIDSRTSALSTMGANFGWVISSRCPV